jgi:hypothetical protein
LLINLHYRFIIIYKPHSLKQINNTHIAVVVASCLFLGLLWAVFPLVGWSYYALEGAQTSCSVKYDKRDLNVMSYNMAMFLFVFFIPLIAIVITSYKMLVMVKISLCYKNLLFDSELDETICSFIED